MTTALDLITDSLQEIGAYAPGNVISAADSSRGLRTLNNMLDSWSNEALTCFTILQQSVVLQPGISQYTIGPGGMINATRPIRLITGPGAAFIRDFNQINYPVAVLPQDEWNLIGQLTQTSDLPDTIFYDPQFPLGVINVYPQPTIAYSLYFDSYQQLTEFSTLVTTVSLPPGYNLAIQHNLAVELHPFFFDVEVPSKIMRLAAKSLGNIKRSNMRPVQAEMDPEVVSRSNGVYNIYSDNYNRMV